MSEPSMTAYDFDAKTIDGANLHLSAFHGHVMLIVNVASHCGYTPQYRGLERLYRKYRAQDFVVLGFPCDQFGHQEPGDDAAIEAFCSAEYDVTFPMFSKIAVNGSGAHPLFKYLKSVRKGWFGFEGIKWNFTKFLISRTGEVLGRFGPTTTPKTLEGDVVAAVEARV